MGGLVDFFESFPKGAKSGDICFFHSQLRKQPFF